MKKFAELMTEGFSTTATADFYKKRYDSLDIRHFVSEGFQKVCDVDARSQVHEWWYFNINKELMYSPHSSWVYFIVIDDSVVKVGESGNPLGLKNQSYYDFNNLRETQPTGGSKARLARLRKGDGTDRFLREELTPYLHAGHSVSIWAKKCPVKSINENIGGRQIDIPAMVHKHMEIAYLEHFKKNFGHLPYFNKATK